MHYQAPYGMSPNYPDNGFSRPANQSYAMGNQFGQDKYQVSTNKWHQPNYSQKPIEQSRSYHTNDNSKAFCSFCKNNQEPEDVYRGHSLKGSNGRVICHHLRAYTCPICKACGDNAHTMKYCPVREKRPTV